VNARAMGTVLRLIGIGWYVAVCIGGGATVGVWLGDKFQSSLFFTLLGLAVGIGLAILGMYRMLVAVLTNTSDSDIGKEG